MYVMWVGRGTPNFRSRCHRAQCVRHVGWAWHLWLVSDDSTLLRQTSVKPQLENNRTEFLTPIAGGFESTTSAKFASLAYVCCLLFHAGWSFGVDGLCRSSKCRLGWNDRCVSAVFGACPPHACCVSDDSTRLRLASVKPFH